MSDKWHAMIRVGRHRNRFRCRTCHYETDLAGAIEHAVANQVRVD